VALWHRALHAAACSDDGELGWLHVRGTHVEHKLDELAKLRASQLFKEIEQRRRTDERFAHMVAAATAKQKAKLVAAAAAEAEAAVVVAAADAGFAEAARPDLPLPEIGYAASGGGHHAEEKSTQERKKKKKTAAVLEEMPTMPMLPRGVTGADKLRRQAVRTRYMQKAPVSVRAKPRRLRRLRHAASVSHCAAVVPLPPMPTDWRQHHSI
jgi:hypothetical protein